MKIRGKSWRMMAVAAMMLAAALVGGLAWSQTGRQAWQEGMGLLGRVLSPRQIKLITGYIKAENEKARAQAKAHEADWEAVGKRLELTVVQEDTLLALVKSYQGGIDAVARPIFQDELALRAELTADAPDPAELRAEAKILADDIGGACVLGSRFATQARAILTPAQQQALDEVIPISDGMAKEQMGRLPGEAAAALALWKEVALTPAQVDGLIGLTDAGLKLADKYGQLEHAQGEARLAAILTPAQMKLLRDFEKAHGPELEAERDEMVAQIMTLRGLNLSSTQMDQLTALVEARLPEIVALVQTGFDQGFALAYLVMAPEPDEAAIRAGAAQMSGFIGDALVLAGQMIPSARGIASPDQYELVLNLVLYGEGKALEVLDEYPGRLAEITALRDQLDLTPPQREALKKLGEQQQQRMEKEWEAFTPGK
jgi:Spy/CpxP family protein refolding chaperone